MGVKFDALQTAINILNIALAKQDGANFPDKINKLETKIEALESIRDSRGWMPDALVKAQDDILEINKFRYKALGIIAAVQLIITIVISAAVKIGLDTLYHAPQ